MAVELLRGEVTEFSNRFERGTKGAGWIVSCFTISGKAVEYSVTRTGDGCSDGLPINVGDEIIVAIDARGAPFKAYALHLCGRNLNVGENIMGTLLGGGALMTFSIYLFFRLFWKSGHNLGHSEWWLLAGPIGAYVLSIAVLWSGMTAWSAWSMVSTAVRNDSALNPADADKIA